MKATTQNGIMGPRCVLFYEKHTCGAQGCSNPAETHVDDGLIRESQLYIRAEQTLYQFHPGAP